MPDMAYPITFIDSHIQELNKKPLNDDESLNTVDTQFSSISNIQSVQTINAYGIKIAEALEVIEIEERAKTQAEQHSNAFQNHLIEILGKRRQPEPYVQKQQQSLLEHIKPTQLFGQTF